MTSAFIDLKRSFLKLKHQPPLRLQDYDGAIRDVVFDVFTAETFIAGIAESLLSKVTPSPQHLEILTTRLLTQDRCWKGTLVTAVDINATPEIARYVELLEEVRRNCLVIVRNQGG